MGVTIRPNSMHSPVTEFLHRETAPRIMQAGDRLDVGSFQCTSLFHQLIM